MTLWAVKVKRSTTETIWVEARDPKTATKWAIDRAIVKHTADVFRAISVKETATS
jgi:hypothetical protein